MTVFEISNSELKEFYLCVSDRAMGELMRGHCEQPPEAIAHWKKNQGVLYNEVEVLPDEKAAKAFLQQYRAVLARTGWKVLP